MSNFIQKCIEGNALIDDIDDFVGSWHESDSSQPLHRFLGMTSSEYSLWIADPDVLPHIVNAHLQERDISDILEEVSAFPLAARSDGPDKALELMNWLKSEGMWK